MGQILANDCKQTTVGMGASSQHLSSKSLCTLFPLCRWQSALLDDCPFVSGINRAAAVPGWSQHRNHNLCSLEPMKLRDLGYGNTNKTLKTRTKSQLFHTDSVGDFGT